LVAGVDGRNASCYETGTETLGQDVESTKFTGKERDAETGLDYFGARYFSGAQGRFTSPDWSATPQPIPYADLKDPQTLNLYAYVRNNPLSRADADGHCPPCVEILESPMVQEALEEAGSATVGMLAGAYIASQESVQNVARDLGDYIATHPPQTASQQDREDLHNLFNPAKQSSSEKVPGPVKAKDAPGVTAGGQATDEHGNKLGGSGKPQVHETESNTREGAKNKALNEGSGAVEHTNPKVGKPHFHPSDAEGNKKPTSVHHNYPDN
jgi:RHS repeat-associated protein